MFPKHLVGFKRRKSKGKKQGNMKREMRKEKKGMESGGV